MTIKSINLIILSLLISTPCYASSNLYEGTAATPPLLQALKLTLEQHARFDYLLEQYETQGTKVPMDLLVAYREAQFELLTQESLDRAAASRLIDEVHAMEKQLILDEMQFKNDVYNMLDEGQQQRVNREFDKLSTQAMMLRQ